MLILPTVLSSMLRPKPRYQHPQITPLGPKTTMAHLLATLLLALIAQSSFAQSSPPTPSPAATPLPLIAIPAQPTPIMPIDQVRIGMKGYGLTVFHGDTIEPFPVEVVSIAHNATPGKSVIWIRCPDARMQQSGPVHGMSGSPIYLWENNSQPQTPGQGGKLIGAFAFGFANSLDCYVGVQPIQYMRNVSENYSPNSQTTPPASASTTSQSFQLLQQLANSPSLSAQSAWRSRAILQTLQPTFLPNHNSSSNTSSTSSFSSPTPSAVASNLPPNAQSPLRPLFLPVHVGSPELASQLNPLFQNIGLTILASGTPLSASKPPSEINPQLIQIKPGSVLSVPLAYGDMDLTAVGTATDVLPNGHVLAFGHPMFGQGPASLPMATGFVHYVLPSRDSSFKLANSALICGTILQDQAPGILGTSDLSFQSAPMTVQINLPNVPTKTYHYQVVHHPRITPLASAILAAQSLISDYNLPLDCTLSIQGTITFTNNRTITINAQAVEPSLAYVIVEILTPIASLGDNPFQSVPVQEINIQLSVQLANHGLSLVEARLEQPTLRPGDSATIHLQIQPYRQPSYHQQIQFALPADLPDGDYQLNISDARSYQTLSLSMQPQLQQIHQADDIVSLLQHIYSLRDDQLYLTLQLPSSGLAIDRMTLPKLPPSRKAILSSPASPPTTPVQDWLQQAIPMPGVPLGQFSLPISVHRELKD